MKRIQKITLLLILLLSAFTINSFAQKCERKEIELSDGFTGSATITGKTGGCNLFYAGIDGGDRVKITLTSTDGKARFTLTPGDGKTYPSSPNLTTFDRVIEVGLFSIDVKGTDSTSFTLVVSVTTD